MCFEAFGNGSHQTLMGWPSHIDISQIGPILENFIVAPYVRQLEQFPRAGAFVTQGGMSSLQEALSFGMPMVVFPQIFEQIINARQIAAIGAGLVLAGHGLTSAGLQLAVTRILTETSFRENSQKQRMYAQAAGGYERAADVIQQFVQQHGVGSQG